jgi:hypothetical protein
VSTSKKEVAQLALEVAVRLHCRNPTLRTLQTLKSALATLDQADPQLCCCGQPPHPNVCCEDAVALRKTKRRKR